MMSPVFPANPIATRCNFTVMSPEYPEPSITPSPTREGAGGGGGGSRDMIVISPVSPILSPFAPRA